MSRVTEMFPIFTVRSLPEALSYYRDKLGFAIAWTLGRVGDTRRRRAR